ncbi:MAG: BrnA antitoxin family protein [Acidobacteriota bacterium]
MQDDEIDYSDAPPLTDAFFERAVLRIPAAEAQDWIKLDPEIASWFRKRGDGYQDRILAVLREHMRTQG